ncbi:MAG TPA: V-type ATPase subunit [Anaeromyxobacteraceae bacterium]|nr:V-type ATPase subunit [Anaeromyxobacteraceae bacterium]
MISVRAPRAAVAGGRDFVLGRLGAARSGLLGAEGLRELASRAAAGDPAAALRGSGWAPAADARTPEDAEAALLARAGRSIGFGVRHLGPGPRRLLLAWLLPDDARALSGALRAQAGALGPERTAALLEPTPFLDRPRLLQVAACADAAAAAALLDSWGSPLAATLRDAGADLRKPGALRSAEEAIHRAAADLLRRAARGPGPDRRALRTLASARLDLAAAAEILALSGEGSPESSPIEGGDRLPAAAAARIAMLPREEAAGALARALRTLLGDPDLSAEALARPDSADHVLGRALVRHARRVARQAPLTVAVPIAWAVEVGEELRRVRLVLRARAGGLPPSRLLDLLEA